MDFPLKCLLRILCKLLQHQQQIFVVDIAEDQAIFRLSRSTLEFHQQLFAVLIDQGEELSELLGTLGSVLGVFRQEQL